MTQSRKKGEGETGEGAGTSEAVSELFNNGASTIRGARTREKLVAAAASCFTEYGYTKTRISDIVQQAGVSQGNFYRHFTNKGDALLAAIEPCVRELLQSSRRAKRSEVSEYDALVDSATSYFATYARNRRLMRVTREASSAQDGSGFAENWLLIRAEFTERTQKWLGRLAETGAIHDDCDVELLAESLGSMTDQMAYVQIGVPAEAPRAEQLTRLGRVVGEIWYRAIPWTTSSTEPGS